MDPVRANTAAVGIDLGTSNTVVAHVDGGVAHAIADDITKEILIPSVCAFHPSGAILVGREAKTRRLQDPKNTVFSTKRLIGRPWGAKEVAQARVRLPYELKEGKNASVLVLSRQKEYTLPEISAFVLRKAKAIADVALKKPVARAVITCPANFDDLQRGATKLAGKLAGLEVLRVLNEPTAAALAYGYGKEGQERILVYDFGGGTFDVTLLERKGDIFQVRATAGDSYLGGDDIDAAIANRIAEGFAAEHFYDPRADRQVFEHVREAAEKLKVKLGSEDHGSIELVDVAFGAGGKSLGFEFSMTRGELAQLADPFIEQTFKVCKKALDLAKVDLRGVDQVLLVGGSTLIPRVRERAAHFFAHEPAVGVSPFEAVAVGAAIQAYAMTDALEDDAGIPTHAALKASRTVSVPPPPAGLVAAAPARIELSSGRGDPDPNAPPATPAERRAYFSIEPPPTRVRPRYSARLLAVALVLVMLLVSWLVRR
jgi:molecular chaperone DnaK